VASCRVAVDCRRAIVALSLLLCIAVLMCRVRSPPQLDKVIVFSKSGLVLWSRTFEPLQVRCLAPPPPTTALRHAL
jgi:hypothetical protein